MLGRLVWGLTFLPAVAFAPLSILNTLLFEPDGALVPAKPLPLNPFMRDGKALVAIVRGEDPPAMLQAGLNLIGGIGRLDLRGKRVLIKPNVVNDRPPRSEEHTSELQSPCNLVCRLLLEKKKKRKKPTKANVDALRYIHSIYT